MRRVLLFGEDHAHEVVLTTLLERLAAEEAVAVSVEVRSATGGHGRVTREVKEFVRELRRDRTALPDLFVVARDANCEGYSARVKEITDAVTGYQGQMVLAVPDPHVERWLLLDSRAFREVLGHGCRPPDQKCDRDRYKRLLDEAVRAAGIEPLLGGVEFAEDILRLMNLDRAGTADASFGHLLRDLRSALRQWKT
jgi:hypothetical protein